MTRFAHHRLAFLIFWGLTLVAPSARADYGEGIFFGAVGWVLAQLAPQYSLALTSQEIEHGLQWELNVLAAEDSRHGAGASVSYYPGAGAVTGRFSYRLYLLRRPEKPGLGLILSAGGFVSEGRAGPRVEGRIFWGWSFLHVFAAGAYEPDLERMVQGGQVAAGFSGALAFR